ncbi:MAG: Tol-Pal system beta propeller repeat protein TolB [Lactobacillales bacterium]|jgi:TolB protein|nr:Tol-Pal system beta propeller repeat protein TolB [Lactobacillales bacterium]
MRTFFLFLFSLFLFTAPASAELRIDISGARSEPIPIAIPYFTSPDWGGQNIAESITDVVAADLERSGLFHLINRDAYIEKLSSADARPKFTNWQAINAHALVVGEVKEENGKLVVSFRLWDIFAQNQMEGKSLNSSKESWRKTAHIIADSIYERITGEKGYFNSKIAYIAETGDQGNKVKRLAVMDQDGANIQYLTSGKDMILTPRFSPNMKEIAYFSYKDGKPKVYAINIETRESALVDNFPGMTFAPRYSPDASKLIMSLAQRGNSDIYSIDLRTRDRKRLTDHPAIDTSPSYSPDGKKIVFNSDRGGNQQLYVMNADGSNVKRISFGEGTYATPVWSPRGDYIAFTKIRNGLFHIGVMRSDGSGERLIANGWLTEGPTWSPNGRVIMFFRQTTSDARGKGGTSKLYTIDVTGHNERQIPTPTDASDPAWSPLLN